MTDQQRAALIAALKRERAGYERAGHPERAKEVDAELRKLGALAYVCEGCGFEAKTAAGLAAHERSHEDDDD